MEEAKRAREDPQKQKEAETLASMLIYHGQFRTNPLLKTKGESWAKKALLMGMRGDEVRSDRVRMNVEPFPRYRDDDDPRGQHWYGCRHIQLNGDCGNYENRPSMCRTYPDGQECNFEGCTMTPEDIHVKKLEPMSDFVESLQASIEALPPKAIKAKLVDAKSLTKKVRAKR